MAKLLGDLFYTALDLNGDVLAGAKLEFFITGTSTNLDTFTDNGLTVEHLNPVVADSSGRFAPIYLQSADYKVTLSTSADVVIETMDPVHGVESANPADLTTDNVFTKTTTWRHGVDVASAPVLALGDGNIFDITGTETITSIATKGVGTVVILQFDGVLTLTHNSNDLVLPGGVDITTAAGDVGIFEEYGTGDWRLVSYLPGAKSLIAPLPTGYLSGGEIGNNSIDAINDIDVSATAVRDDTDSVNLVTTANTIIALDATGAGGLDTGLKAPDTWYHIWMIGSITGVNPPGFMFSTSPTAPVMPSGYDAKALLKARAVLTDSTAAPASEIIPFIYIDGQIRWVTPPEDVNTTYSTTWAVGTLSVPTGISVSAIMQGTLAAGNIAKVRAVGASDAAPTVAGVGTFGLTGAAAAVTSQFREITDTSAQIEIATSNAAAQNVTIDTIGWIVPLGSQGAASVAGQIQSIVDFGARVDGVEGTDGATTDGSATFTSISSAFTETDVGKHISIEAVGAGTAITDVDAHNIKAKHVWQVDDTPSDNAFVDITTDFNDVGTNDCVLFPATEAIGDYVAFGYETFPDQISFDYTTGTVGVGGVVVWEYWNGAWTTFTGLTDNTVGFTAAAGVRLLTYTKPTDAVTSMINDVPSLFWIRARITTVYTTNPVIDQGKVEVVRVTAASHTFFSDAPFDSQRVTVKGVTGTTEANGNFRVDIPRTIITNCIDNGSGLIRCTDDLHPYTTGDGVTITDVRGTTEANGAHTVTVIDEDTYDLQGSTFTNTFEADGRAKFTDKFNLVGTVFVNAYTAGGTAHGPLSTTISARINSTSVTLATNALATASAQDFFYGTDNTSAVQAAMNAVEAAGTGSDPGGGFLDIPSGICLHGQITYKERVIIRGQGLQAAVLKAIGGLDDHLFLSKDFATLTGTDVFRVSEGVPSYLGFQECQIDGSKRFQRAVGDGIRFYAKALFFENVIVRDCKGNGIYTETGTLAGQAGFRDWPQGHISGVDTAQNGGHGWHMRGPHDMYSASAVSHLNGGDGIRLETLASTYLATTDFSFVQCYANAGRGIYGIRSSFRAAFARLENSDQEGLFLEDCDNSPFGIVHLFDNAKVIGDYQGVIDTDSNYNSIASLSLRRQGRVAAGGLQVAGLNNKIDGVLQGNVTGGGNSTGAGLDIPSGAQHNVIDVVVSDFSGTGGIGLRTGNGGQNNFNAVTASIQNCSTLWNNVTASVGNHYRITGGGIAADTKFSGVGPSTALTSQESWDVTLRNATPSIVLSRSRTLSGIVNFNITTEQLLSVPHSLLAAPPEKNINLTLINNGTNATKALQYMEIRGVDATNVDIAIRFDTAAGAASNGHVSVEAWL